MPWREDITIHWILEARWRRAEPPFRAWLRTHGPADVRPLPPGYEADVAVLTDIERPQFVVKRWRPQWQIDAEGQSRFLSRAKAFGLPVPVPAATGVDADGRSILVMEYCGEALWDASDAELKRVGAMLAQIHRAPPVALGFELPEPIGSPIDNILARFFPRLDRHPDIRAACMTVAAGLDVIPPRVIHGDFNFGNVLRNAERRLSIIDWTDVGVGDPRYDLAWAMVILWIYSGQHAADLFLSAYRTAIDETIDLLALARLQTVAALQWILLDRHVTLREGQATRRDIGEFVENSLPDSWRGRFSRA